MPNRTEIQTEETTKKEKALEQGKFFIALGIFNLLLFVLMILFTKPKSAATFDEVRYIVKIVLAFGLGALLTISGLITTNRTKI